MAEKMRSRFLNKMTNDEVEKYLDRNDIIFIPIGTIETHGRFPLDVELTAPKAFSLLMAEKVDGLVLGDLPYFFCGATTTARGTIQMSVEKGVQYLKEISHSLLNQGFRRQIYVSLHGPAFLTAGTVVIDFFDETKVPITYIDLINAINIAKERNQNLDLMKNANEIFFGGYEILGTKDELVIDPDADMKSPFERIEPRTEKERMIGRGESPNVQFFNYLRRFAHPSGSVGFYYSEPSDHGGEYGAARTIEERDALCVKGAEVIRSIVDALDMDEYVDEMRQLDVWTSSLIKEKYSSILPKNKFSPWI
ncbi:creatininase family protein [Cohnella silvisoli]|uniref:Creatininase family protein n=1 Tax=Cohnella silvisoli TaxID=2873699 RepID=A0ABV1L0L5_9BACL|nr:creatininase family protein [Cohnella silvisoli]MCD9025115.1 creatininase family protein [Cohnella silvisoli]